MENIDSYNQENLILFICFFAHEKSVLKYIIQVLIETILN